MNIIGNKVQAEAEVSGVRYQWLGWAEGDEAVIVAYQRQHDGRWAKLGVDRQRLHGGSVAGVVDEAVSRWLAYSAENGHEVRRTA